MPARLASPRSCGTDSELSSAQNTAAIALPTSGSTPSFAAILTLAETSPFAAGASSWTKKGSSASSFRAMTAARLLPLGQVADTVSVSPRATFCCERATSISSKSQSPSMGKSTLARPVDPV